MPKSSRTRSPRYERYCSHRGRSNPSSCRNDAIASGEAPSGTRSNVGSPEKCITIKTIVSTPKIAMTACVRRLKAYFSMALSSLGLLLPAHIHDEHRLVGRGLPVEGFVCAIDGVHLKEADTRKILAEDLVSL